MNLKELIKTLKSYNRAYYAKRELELIFRETGRKLNDTIKMLVDVGILEEIANDVYAVFTSYYDAIEVASQLYMPNYLSFESALSRYDVLNQVPYTITFATTKKSKEIEVAKRQVEFIQIPQNLFFGYMPANNNFFIATPEKAFLDIIYLATVNNYVIDLDELNLKRLSQDIISEYIKAFPGDTVKYLKRIFKKVKVSS